MLLTVRRGLVFSSCVLFLYVLSSQSLSAQGSRTAAPGEVSANGTALLAREIRRTSDAWVPADIDFAAPSVNPSEPCSLPDVVARAGSRVQETVQNLDRFTATEFVEHQSVSRTGKLAKVQTRKFDYLVSIAPGRGGYLSLREYRSRSSAPAQFPDRIATEGTPSLVLVFHPLYARDFDMKCEGLGAWHGQPAWQVRFEQRRNGQKSLSNMVVKDKLYSLRLRGRAWILADSYQVTRLETDLVEAVPAIKLRIEHMDVEYRPVAFPGRDTELWLPASAELYLDFSGRRFYRKHRFTDFTLFTVDVEQQFAAASTSPR